MNNQKPPSPDKKQVKIKAMIAHIDAIIAEAKRHENSYKKQLKKVHPDRLASAKNLIHYRSLRLHDMSALQKQLGNMGLSRMSKAQPNILAGLETTKTILKVFLGKTPIITRTGLSFKKANRLGKTNAKNLLGYRSKGRHTRIMVTIPSEGATNYEMIEHMIAMGMNCARINCAHDTREDWLNMIKNIRKASIKLKKRCKVAMDLAGPKIRTGKITPGPKVKKLRPPKDVKGNILNPLKFYLGPNEDLADDLSFLSLDQAAIDKLKAGDKLYFHDTRGKKRNITIVEKQDNKALAEISKTSYLETGMKLFFDKDRSGAFIEVGNIPELAVPIILKKGDSLRINRSPIIGEHARLDENGISSTMAHISCTAPEIFNEIEIGAVIKFDDGKICGIIKEIHEDHALVEITQVLEKGGKLRGDKGINLPDSKLSISGMTAKDKEDLEFVIMNADVVNMSFVNNTKDVSELLNELKRLNAKPELGVILKIETQNGFNHLTEILLEAMQHWSIGVMIARGDLAIEVGWKNIGRVQQEILSLCESAHVTNIWATQVLENLAKNGVPSRAEITDVIKAQQADCVMLNKGPYILDSIRFLDEILKEMEPYREKSARFTPPMKLANPKN